VNRRGPRIVDARATEPVPLTAQAVQRLRAAGALVVDVRTVPDYAAAHVPGALSIPLRAQFATWLGWLAPTDAPLVIVCGDGQDPDEVGWQAREIGYDDLAGLDRRRVPVGGGRRWSPPSRSATAASSTSASGRSSPPDTSRAPRTSNSAPSPPRSTGCRPSRRS
jgi:rhodanese-related sulfurtransferase